MLPLTFHHLPLERVPRGVGVEQRKRREHGRRSAVIEAARRASLAEKEADRLRASELAVGASSSRTVEIAGGTTDGAVVAEDTTEGGHIAEDMGSGEPDPPSC